jgi:signal transduction histidine kinase
MVTPAVSGRYDSGVTGHSPGADRGASAGPPPGREPSGWGSPTRQFAILSLVTLGGSTLVLGLVLTYFVERGILDREWASTAALVRTAARFYLRPGDFGPGAAEGGEAGDRFEEFTRQVRMLPEIERIAAYDARGGSLWTDAGRGGPSQAPHEWLRQALEGETSVRFAAGGPGGRESVKLYVPVTYPGEGRIAGVVEADVDPSRVLAAARQARLTLWTLALASGALLYAVLYGIVWRASRMLRRQHAALTERAEELARTTTELGAVRQQLVSAARLAAFGEITAAVAHGLGNPLAAIRGMAQLALLESAEPGVQERLQQVVVQADRLGERMRALLRLGRPVEQQPLPSALDRVVAVTLDSVQVRATTGGVRVEIDVPPDLPKVRLDPAGFEEAFLCLVGNAFDAMPSGGVLRVRAATGSDGGATVRLVVEDTGPGMSPAVLQQVFEPFFTTKRDGTGLGLALARKLLEAAGAGLALESEPGRGTRAVIVLPVDGG